MNKNELQWIVKSLDELLDYQNNAGCNDFSMPKTPENIAFMKKLNLNLKEDVFMVTEDKKEITGLDLCITSYLKERLQQEINSMNLENQPPKKMKNKFKAN